MAPWGYFWYDSQQSSRDWGDWGDDWWTSQHGKRQRVLEETPDNPMPSIATTFLTEDECPGTKHKSQCRVTSSPRP